MDTKQAVRIAKNWIVENFAADEIQNVGLEEVKFDDLRWYITIGFSRPWENSPIVTAFGSPVFTRVYKVVVVDQ